jgi:membrane protease YdiL (CAAX protease family)
MLFLTSVSALGLSLGATAALVLLVRVGIRLTGLITPVAERPSTRALASRAILGAAIGQALCVTLVAAVLLRAGLSLGDLGLTRSAPRPVWGAAILLAILTAALLVAGPLRRSATLRESSAYRVSGGLVAGLAGGLGEELVFRGFVMTVLAWGGYSTAAQIVASSVLFALARAAWRGGVGAVAPTALVGAMYGSLYVWGGRSLLPVIGAHALISVLVEPALLETTIARGVKGWSGGTPV